MVQNTLHDLENMNYDLRNIFKMLYPDITTNQISKQVVGESQHPLLRKPPFFTFSKNAHKQFE